MEHRRYHSMDAMRGIAAIIVALYHIDFIAYSPVSGYLAVDLFFALSGFVIAAAYDDRLKSGLNAFNFMMMRLVRLYPIYALGSLLGLVHAITICLMHTEKAMTPFQIATSGVLGLFMLPSPFNPNALYSLNGPAWSLFFELVINAVFALILFRKPNLVIGSIIAFAALALALLAMQFGTTELGVSWATSTGGLARTFFGFCAGILIQRMTNARRLRISWLAVIPLACLSIILISPVSLELRLIYDLSITFVAVPALIAISALLDLPRAAHRTAAWLGDISYPIYMIHLPMVSMANGFVKKFALSGPTVCAFLIVVILIAATLIPALYDTKARDWLNERFGLKNRLHSRVLVPVT